MNAVQAEMRAARTARVSEDAGGGSSSRFVTPRPPPSSVGAVQSHSGSSKSRSSGDKSSSGLKLLTMVDAQKGGTPSTPESTMSSLDSAGAVRRTMADF
eukprot:3356823-Rhodomonas_salina.1